MLCRKVEKFTRGSLSNQIANALIRIARDRGVVQSTFHFMRANARSFHEQKERITYLTKVERLATQNQG